ncbi:MAG: TonB-dependent receptor, partial [Saprospiraceae bacterium]|nr:TonB-dependent receptor [Saprospiraceae bacterium]
MKPLFIFLRWLPWLCTPALLSAQNQLTVSVLDATSKEPVVGATLSAKMQHWGAVTDSAGAIIIPADFKEAQIHVHCIGYRPWAGAIPPARVILIEPDESLLGTVVVTATMKEVSKDVSPIPVEIYTHRFFQKSASPSIFEALVAVNGVKPQLNCNVCNTGDIHINGMEGPYTMVTIDGMPLVGGLASVYGLSGIPNGIVDRIEIIKGPAGVLFGSEAVGGVVNIITKNTQSAPRLFADVYMASNQEFNTELAYNSRIGKARNLTGVNYFNYQNPQDINGDNFTDVALQHRISIFNKTAVALKNQQFATLGWRYIYEDRWGGELQWSPQWRGTDSIYGESIYTKRFELIAKLPFNIRKQLFQLDLSGNLHHQNSAYGTTLFLGNQHITFGQLSTTINHNEQVETLIGAAVRYTFYNDNTPATTSVSRTWLPGVFLQSMFRLNNRNTLLGGLRYDYNSIHRHILTPRVSWKWSPEPGHAL